MAHIILVTGGARSGKSNFAEKYVKVLEGKTLYIATAIAFDEEMKDRIKKHQSVRPANWDTYEGFENLDQIIQDKGNEYNRLMLDCVTLWVTNLFFKYVKTEDYDSLTMEAINEIERKILNEVNQFVGRLKETAIEAVLVTNELGSSLVPENKLGRIFRDIQGRINQQLGHACDEVYLVVCGQPLKIK